MHKDYIDKNKNYYLREVSINDAKDIFEFAKLETVTKYLNWHKHKTIDETIEVINKIYLNKNKYPNSFVIIDNKKKKAIGIIDFNDGPKDNMKYPNVGYFLNPKYWNEGIMSKALNSILKKGFNELNYSVIAISHLTTNKASMRVIKNNGFKHIKSLKDVQMGKHKKVDIEYYELLRSDFYENQ